MTRDNRTAAEALTEFATQASEVIGFAYSPVDAPWFRLGADGVARDANGDPLVLTGVFELRAFSPDRELRWWNTSAGRGCVRVITDQAMRGQHTPAANRTYRRLLWGTTKESTQDSADWLTLFEPRIGDLSVPVAGRVDKNSQVWLEAVEYHDEDSHGNVAVTDERLIRLITVAPRKADTGTLEDTE